MSKGIRTRRNRPTGGVGKGVHSPLSRRFTSSAIALPCAGAAPGVTLGEGLASAPQPMAVMAIAPGWSCSTASWANPAQSPLIVFSAGSTVVQWQA